MNQNAYGETYQGQADFDSADDVERAPCQSSYLLTEARIPIRCL